jgi:CheY-like chemotaxis protein/anti-sigma regulatory factor (Ser/Thr protein kinase)
MSHELRTPLNSILGVSEVLETGTYGELSAKQQDGIRTIINSGQHLLSLITDVLELKKNEAGYGAIDTRPLSCEDIGLASMALVGDTTKEKQVAFETIVSEATAWVRADERYLKQILVNLLGNAVKFTPDGGSVTLEIRASADTTMVDFIVSDTGIGISEEDLQRVFLPFVQVDSALSRNYGGTGLGLALVSRFVDLHGGRILVESELGKGSQFTVSIPRAEPPADEKAQSRDEPPKVMTVEIQDEMTKMFVQLGARVDHQQTGGNALENVEVILPDVIAINSPLPDMSSLEFMRRLKECPATRQTPLVFATSDDAGAASRQTTADILLTKPLALQSMRNALQQLVARPTAKTPTTGNQTGLVLIVEDNPANIPHLKDFLVFKGHAVEIATNGQAGIEMAQSLKPDVVLMDIQMPGMSGLTAIEEIRRDSDLDHVKVVAVTAHAMEEDRRRCMEAGANEYIAKPYQLSSLYEMISGWIGPGA